MNRRGFTFVELVCVWAIIAVLAAILFPVFARAQEKGRQTNCVGNLLNIGAALKMYAYDHYGHMPPTDNELRVLVPSYLPEAEVFLCPSASGRHWPSTPPVPNPEAAKCDYVYRGGLCDDDMPNQVIASDDECDRHNDGASYLFLTGRCKWLKSYLDAEERKQMEGYDELIRLRGDEPEPEDEELPPGIPEEGMPP
jgi:prepilin-type N-terminal cleavage/methylation domain-containing protein